MHSISCMPISSPSSHTFLKHNPYPSLGDVSSKPCLPLKRRANFTTRALLSSTKDSVLREFHERRALKIISGLRNFNKDNIASVVTAADKGGATHVDIACDPELVKLAISLTSCPVYSYCSRGYPVIPIIYSCGVVDLRLEYLEYGSTSNKTKLALRDVGLGPHENIKYLVLHYLAFIIIGS